MREAKSTLEAIAAYYAGNKRTMPWRLPEADGSFDAYKILVSEIMLQQTQVPRVIPKYEVFIQAFPDIDSLAAANLSDVFKLWVGLGYNRRAKYLYEAARHLATIAQPWTYDDLVAQKGIGPNTANAVLAYAYNLPVLFIETNIRTVIIHHCFKDQSGISDKQVISKLETIVPWKQAFTLLQNSRGEYESRARGADEEQTEPYSHTVKGVPQSATKRSASRKSSVASSAGEQTFPLLSPREFYWAMMDYGTYLKSTQGKQNHRSKSYAKQAKFEGSRRQIRGKIIRLLTAGPVPITVLKDQINDERFEDVLEVLNREELVTFQDEYIMLYTKH